MGIRIVLTVDPAHLPTCAAQRRLLELTDSYEIFFFRPKSLVFMSIFHASRVETLPMRRVSA